jgi:hypothetical protein
VFAAMSPYYNHPWLLNLLSKLLQGQPDVLGLLRDNPFPEEPPAFVRVRHYIYRFTGPGGKGLVETRIGRRIPAAAFAARS